MIKKSFHHPSLDVISLSAPRALFLITALLALTLFLTGCGNPTASEPDIPLPSLVNTVWAGETPRTGDWLTMTFRADNKITCSFIFDNTSNEWTFAYDGTVKTGTITPGGGGWAGPAPEGFTVSKDAKTITIPNYGDHGDAKEFKRLRQADLTLDANPFSPGALADTLVGSIWAGSTPAENGAGWITVGFRAKSDQPDNAGKDSSQTGPNVAVISYGHDSTTAVWDYSYSSRSGTAPTNGHKPNGDTTTWNPGAYTISADDATLTFTSFMGSSRDFKRFR